MNRKLLSVLIVAAAPLVAQEKTAPVPTDKPVEIKPAEVKQLPHSGGNAWFQVTDQDLGTYFHHEEAVGHFPFQNPGDKPVEWKSFQASCQCSKAIITVGGRRYDYSNKPTPNMLVRLGGPGDGKGEAKKDERVTQIEIGPHEAGEVEVHMDMAGFTGTKQASLDIHTTDPAMPMMKLQWHAVGAQMFQVAPAEVNLNQMTWNEKREFTVTVTSPVARDFNITRMDDAGKDFDVKYEKALKDGLATWTVHGTYGPVSTEASAAGSGSGGGGVLKFYTDIKGEPTFMVRVQAMVQGPMEVKPGSFIGFGMIHKGNARTERITFTPNDGTDLDATSIAFEDLTVDPKFVTTRKSKDGKTLVVELEIGSGAPVGLLKGRVVIKLNHPAVKEKSVLFNGYVR